MATLGGGLHCPHTPQPNRHCGVWGGVCVWWGIKEGTTHGAAVLPIYSHTLLQQIQAMGRCIHNCTAGNCLPQQLLVQGWVGRGWQLGTAPPTGDSGQASCIRLEQIISWLCCRHTVGGTLVICSQRIDHGSHGNGILANNNGYRLARQGVPATSGSQNNGRSAYTFTSA